MQKLEKSDLIILLLYSAGPTGVRNEPIVGITRLIKLLFLLEKETKVSEIFNFVPFKMGPFSSEVYPEVEFLQNFPSPENPLINSIPTENGDNLVNPEQIKYIDDTVAQDELPLTSSEINTKFTLSEIGKKLAEKLWNAEPEQVKKIEFIKKKYAGLSLRQLLRYVYHTYPEMTIKSEIKDQL